MQPAIELPRRISDLRNPLQPGEDPRKKALIEFDRRIENLRRCVHWAVENGITVIESKLCRAGGIVTVSASPFLLKLLSGDRSWRKRRQEGALVFYTWFAMRFDTRIEWEEVCA